MRLVEYTDPGGYKRLAWLCDRDSDEEVAAFGIPHDPPNVGDLDLPDEQARALHNALVERRLIVWHNSTAFKRGLVEAAQAAGLDARQTALLQKLYTTARPGGPVPKASPALDLQAALEILPYSERQRDCIKRTFAQAGIRCLADVQNAPTRVGHMCGLDIYQIVARLTGKEV